MAKGKRSDTWDHTCSIIATLYNVNGSKGVSAEQIHPMKKRRRTNMVPGPKAKVSILKKLFIDKRPQEAGRNGGRS